ncbi:MAG: hypothetical protein WDZ49_15140 [Litorilinea sp.]
MPDMPSATDLRARKRAELGLSPQRPTAKNRVARPPASAQRSWLVYLLPGAVILIMAITIVLILREEMLRQETLGIDTRANGLAGLNWQSDWSWARLAPPDSPLADEPDNLPQAQNSSTAAVTSDATSAPRSASATSASATSASATSASATSASGSAIVHTGVDASGGRLTHAIPHLLVADNFSQPTPIFAGRDVAGQWRMEHIPHKAIYRMEVWPGHVAWSLLDPATLTAGMARSANINATGNAPANAASADHPVPQRMQTAAAVAAHTPWGYAGLVTRVAEGRQLVLFAVDGHRRYTVQIMRAGVPEVAVPWTAVDALNPAGTSNVLTIEDDGTTLRFFGNQFPLYQMDVAAWETGSLGIAAGALREGVGEARFEWFQLYGYDVDSP